MISTKYPGNTGEEFIGHRIVDENGDQWVAYADSYDPATDETTIFYRRKGGLFSGRS